MRLVVMVLLVLASCDKKADPTSSEPAAAGSAAPAPGASKAKGEADEAARAESVGGGIAAGLDEVAGSRPRAGSAAVVAPPGTNTATPPTTPTTPPGTPQPTPTPAPPPSGSNTAATPPPLTPAADTLKVGDRVMARWTNGSWYPGKIVAISTDGKYDVNYDDGDKSRGLPASKVRKKIATAGGGKSGGGGKASSSDAPCPGPGITRRCNGVCVNIQENNNHCGGCNNKCPSGKACDGHMFCRDGEGNL
jgi:hypothetical protein